MGETFNFELDLEYLSIQSKAFIAARLLRKQLVLCVVNLPLSRLVVRPVYSSSWIVDDVVFL